MKMVAAKLVLFLIMPPVNFNKRGINNFKVAFLSPFDIVIKTTKLDSGEIVAESSKSK